MYPEDRVLVAYMPEPADFEIVQQRGWYRIPQKHAPKGLYAEYYAFYFGRKFGERKWAIHYYARQQGYELFTRRELLPEQGDHPRASDLYYKVTLGPLIELEQPIISLRWHRITFAHTTWDRFQDAREINDLFIEGGEYVDRLFATLKEQGIRAKRNYRVEESGVVYDVPLAVLCQNGRIDITNAEIPQDEAGIQKLTTRIESEVVAKGGLRMKED